jgi:hypothetical protein
VAGAPEEIDAARKLLATIDLRGAIVTGDAAHACAETAQKIIEGARRELVEARATVGALGTPRGARSADVDGASFRLNAGIEVSRLRRGAKVRRYTAEELAHSSRKHVSCRPIFGFCRRGAHHSTRNAKKRMG